MRGRDLAQGFRVGPLAFVVAVGIAAPSAAQQGAPVTFSKDIAPIFQARCQSCHQPNSIAPMSVLTYKEARPWARSIKDRVMRRQMGRLRSGWRKPTTSQSAIVSQSSNGGTPADGAR